MIKICVGISLVSLLAVNFAHAQYFQKDMMKKRQADKEASRWTLADYLAQKREIGLMDLWLSKNRERNVFDLALVGGSISYEATQSGVSGQLETSDKGTYYALSAYLWDFGVQSSYEKQDPDRVSSTLSLNYRLLGAHLQSTYLILKYGVRKYTHETLAQEWQAPFYEAEFALYILKFLGVYGRYQKIVEDKSADATAVESERQTLGLLIESGWIRIFGEAFTEDLKWTQASGGQDSESREGTLIGLGFYF